MKLIFIFLALTFAACLPAMGEEQNQDLVKLIKKHAINADGSYTYSKIPSRQYADNKQFIFNDDDAVLERSGFIAMPKKPEGKEIYVGR